MENKLPTIAEVAKVLGISERGLRQRIARRGWESELEEGTRNTASGTRSVKLVPATLLLRLQNAEPIAEQEPEHDREHGTGIAGETDTERAGVGEVFTFSDRPDTAGNTRPAAVGNDSQSSAAPPDTPSDALILAKDAMIEMQKQQIEYLQLALEREQKLRLGEQQLQANEQQNRALLPSVPVEEKKNHGGRLVKARMGFEVYATAR